MEEEEVAHMLLNVNTASNNLCISDDSKTVSWSDRSQNRPDTPERFQDVPQVMSSQSFSSGRHCWEVDVGESGSWRVGMCYPSIARRGHQSEIGHNNKSWGLQRWLNHYSVIYNSEEIRLPEMICSNKVRIYLDYEAGQISFYAMCDPIRHLHTFNVTFTEPLHAVLWVWGSCINICRRTNIEDVQIFECMVYADILLDVNTAGKHLHILHNMKLACRSNIYQNHPNTPERFQDYSQVLSSQSFSSGQHYWEVYICGSGRWRVGMCYVSIARRGLQSLLGNNYKSWSLDSKDNQYSMIHNNEEIRLPDKIPSGRVRIVLDYEAGQISFYAMCDPIRHLHTFTTTFTEPLHAAIWVGNGFIIIAGRPNIRAVQQISEIPQQVDILMDITTASNLLKISEDKKIVSWTFDEQYCPETPVRFEHYPQVLSKGSLSSGRHYWKVDVRRSCGWIVGMCYPSIDRRGRPQSLIGSSNRSWGLTMEGEQCSARHDRRQICLPTNIYSNIFRIDLDYEAGKISFFALCNPIRHLHTFTATFTEPLHAALCVWEGCITILSEEQNTGEIH